MVMVQLETDEQWNFLKFVMVVKVFNKVLRQTFKRMWKKKYGLSHQWDDSNTVRKLLCNKEFMAKFFLQLQCEFIANFAFIYTPQRR